MDIYLDDLGVMAREVRELVDAGDEMPALERWYDFWEEERHHYFSPGNVRIWEEVEAGEESEQQWGEQPE